ncbi:class D sortase [Terrisporobacter glycolicus]|uniref:class D sortase n=1 Tax=Terrisporobacter glycolicus TaxID=36841 RepID=UPI000AD0A9C5
MRKIVGKMLILLGSFIICSVIYINYSTVKNNNEIVKIYENDNYKNDEEKNDLVNNVVCILEIPKINIRVAVKEGTDKGTLEKYVGHFENTALPGEKGNFAVAGHSAYTTNKFFSNLNELEIDDSIKAKVNEKEYLYKVTDIQVVKPENLKVLNPQKQDSKEITLVTCTPKYIGTDRLVVKGVVK